MATRPRNFNPDFYYHVYNRGTEGINIFNSDEDYYHFLDSLAFYSYDQPIPYTVFKDLNPKTKAAYLNPKGWSTKRVKILAFCAMPNHFHLLLKPTATRGIPRFISDISNSHTRYFNLKHERAGRLFQETYKAKEISSEPSLMQVIRYIHLNPVFSSKTNPKKALIKPQDYPYSSYQNWIGQQSQSRLDQEELEQWLSYSGGPDKYRSFVESKITSDVASGIEDLILESLQPLGLK